MTAHPFLPWLGGIILALSMGCASLQAATRYGEDFVRLGGDWPETRAWRAPGERVREVGPQHREQLRELEARLQASEQAAGPYAPALAEALNDLGRLYREAGELDQSLRAYRRALHVVRINQGLYSEGQLPLLRQVLEVQGLRGDWQALDERYDYYFRALSAQAGEDLEAVLEYLRWQRQALRLEFDKREDQRLLRLLGLNADLLQSGAALDAPTHWALLESQLHNLYLLQAWQAPVVMQRDTGLRSAALAGVPMELSAREQRLINLQRSAVNEGTVLLEQFLARPDLGDVELRARAHLALADWEQWNGRRGALERYASLVAWLDSQQREDLRRAWFAEPVELPDNGVFWRPGDAESAAVLADYSVSPEGRARGVDTRAGDEAARGYAIHLYRQLLSTRFRPAFGDAGAPQMVEGLERRYRVSARR
ncbi:hypothetical protein [Haliea atlantica]